MQILGIIMKKFYNIIALVMVGLIGFTFTSCSDDDLDTNPYGKSGVNLLAFGPSPILRTNELRITGTNMQNVSQVIFPGADPVTSFNKRDNENIYVNVPDESVPGHIKLIAGKDTVTSEGTLTFEEPIEVTEVTPTTGLNAGDIITVKGDYVYNIASVTFTAGVEVAAEDFVSVSRREIQIAVPLAAESGTITFSDGADWSFEYETPLEILSASYSSLSSAEGEFGSQVTIKGTNLHTVETVMFGGGVAAEFTLVDNNTIVATVPAECKTGSITMLTYSGAAITTDEFAVPTVSIETISQTEDIVEGDVLTLTGQNFTRIKNVYIPGVSEPLSAEQYTITDDNNMTITIPADVSDGDIQLVQNAYITATTTIKVRKLEGVIWQGKTDLSGWSSYGVFSWESNWSDFQQAVTGAGQFTVHFVVTGDNPVFNIRMGDWTTAYSSMSIPYSDDGNVHPASTDTDIVLDLTADEAAAMFGDGAKGFVIWGDGIQVQYIKFVLAGAEYTIWEGREDTQNWSNNYTVGSDTSPELAASGATAGSVVRFYGEVTSPEWQAKIVEGHWGPTYGYYAAVNGEGEFANAEYDFEGNGNCLKLTLTQEMLDTAYTKQGWGGTFIIQGQYFILTKVTVAPF